RRRVHDLAQIARCHGACVPGESERCPPDRETPWRRSPGTERQTHRAREGRRGCALSPTAVRSRDAAVRLRPAFETPCRPDSFRSKRQRLDENTDKTRTVPPERLDFPSNRSDFLKEIGSSGWTRNR